MIKNYSRPQLLIKQVLDQIEDAYAPGMNALIVGPQYDLNRVNNEDEFAEMLGSAVALPQQALLGPVLEVPSPPEDVSVLRPVQGRCNLLLLCPETPLLDGSVDIGSVDP